MNNKTRSGKAMVTTLQGEFFQFQRLVNNIAHAMDFTFIYFLGIILAIIFFSSGIAVFNPGHLQYLRNVSKRNKLFGWMADVLISALVIASRMRRAWIRMISPERGVD